MVCAVTGSTAAAKPLPTAARTKSRRESRAGGTRLSTSCCSIVDSVAIGKAADSRNAAALHDPEASAGLHAQSPHAARFPRDAPSSTPRWPGQLAAIDMGSNSFRLEIGQLHQGRYRRIDYLKETVRLGAGLDANGLLTEEAAQRGLACLARFAQRLNGFAPQQVRAVATQTLREARNRDAFLLRAQTVLGQPIEVISGREEARLIYAGVARLQPSNVPRLVIDIGGRSTEMILGQGRKPLRGRVVPGRQRQPVDALLRRRPLHRSGLPRRAGRRRRRARGGARALRAGHWHEALGSSGTVGAVSQLLAASGVTDGRITPDGLRWLIERCLHAGHVDRLDLPGLKDERRAVIAGGLADPLHAGHALRHRRAAAGTRRAAPGRDLRPRRAPARHRAGAGRPRHARRLGARAAAPLHGRRAAGAARRAASPQALYEQVQPRRRPRGAPRAALGLRAARDRHDGLAPRPPPPQRLPARRMSTRRASRRASSAASASWCSASAAACARSRRA